MRVCACISLDVFFYVQKNVLTPPVYMGLLQYLKPARTKWKSNRIQQYLYCGSIYGFYYCWFYCGWNIVLSLCLRVSFWFLVLCVIAIF